MKAAVIAAPGIAWGAYPERSVRAQSLFADFLTSLAGRLGEPFSGKRGHQSFLDEVHAHAATLRDFSTQGFQASVTDLRMRLARAGLTSTLVAESFALVREATRRELGLAQFDTQLIAARIMITNRLAEMQTGEGKTLASLLTVATAALAGIPVHVITANDYLVTRDVETLQPVYHLLGLTLGAVTQPCQTEQRRAAYACDVTYCTAKELVFDYLRDRLILGRKKNDLERRVAQLETNAPQARPLLRGLCMALIDEADSILIDEARTPFILSKARVNAQQTEYYAEALRLAGGLALERDFRIDTNRSAAELTASGRARLAELAASLGGIWQDRRRREEVAALALAAQHVFKRDRHYLVREGQVLIIDETTGRLAAGRVWSRGLQQLIEIKEGCPASGEQDTIAQITYQRFFPRYLRLCGMSGTLAESAGELRSVYALDIAAVPLRQPSRRVRFATQVFADQESKWNAVVARIAELKREARPVLIGTDSVADSETLSNRLRSAGLSHDVLNARNDQAESEIIARAGEASQITVATNMAGRGTDIPLGARSRQRGGLHVISCQHNASARIDRQLHGRCARQGDPGSVETILSLEDSLISRYLPAFVARLLAGRYRAPAPLPQWLAWVLIHVPQRLEQRKQWLARSQLLKQDALNERQLSFGAPGE